MDSIKSSWQELKTESGPKCPVLFYNFTADEDGYEVKFTDLVGFWTASSPVVDTISYAKVTRASIDPSESRNQLQMLFEKLKEGLAEGINTLCQEDGENEDVLLLQTMLNLPKPLQPLKWEFYLMPQGTGKLAENVLRPCLLEASESQKRLESLRKVITAKDHVISKLMERIEASSTDLSTIFPGITGARSRKGQTTLKDAERHVPGLKTFSMQDWMVQFQSDSPYAGFEAAGLSKLVAGCMKCPKHETHQHDRWLTRLPKTLSSASQAAREQADRNNASSDDDPTASDTDSDDFETQRQKDKGTETVETMIYDQPAYQKDEPLRRRRISPANHPNSSLLPQFTLPPLLKETTSDNRYSSMTAAGSDTVELDISTSKPSRLGKRSRTSRSAKASHLLTQEGKRSASSSQSSSSPIISSSPPLPRPSTAEARPKSSSSVATLSSLNPITPPKRRLGRLGTFRNPSISGSVSETPEHQQTHCSDGSHQPVNDQITPSRRLGRLGRTTSFLASQLLPDSPDCKLEENYDNHQQEKLGDSDTSTISTASSVSPTPAKMNVDAKDVGLKPMLPAISVAIPLQTQTTQVAAESSAKEPEKPEEELTKEEKAAKRREELKRKIEPSSNSAGSATGAGIRKKRKF